MSAARTTWQARKTIGTHLALTRPEVPGSDGGWVFLLSWVGISCAFRRSGVVPWRAEFGPPSGYLVDRRVEMYFGARRIGRVPLGVLLMPLRSIPLRGCCLDQSLCRSLIASGGE